MSKAGTTPEWLRLQRKIFSRWVNQKLWMSRHIRVEDVVASVQEDPTVLTQLVEVLTDKTFTVKKARSNMRVVKINTANDVLKIIYGEGIQMKIKTSAEDLIDGDEKNVLALVFSILLKFMKIGDDEDGPQLSAKDALLMWVQNKTAGYKGVNVTNFTTSFHSGLALCALIHKFRPQLIDYDSLNEGDKLKNIQIAMDAAQKYFGLEQYITPAEVLKLDESGMLVYVSEYFYGIAEQRKIDQAARRIQKVIKFTKKCDKLRADFAADSAAYLERLKKVEVVLEDRTIDNTMAGAQKKLEEFYKYKTEDKNVILGYQLSLESLFNNLSMLLVQNNRPEFVPPAGLSLKDIEAAMLHLEQVEQERKVALHAELNRQIKLVKLDAQHKSIHAKLAAYGEEKLAYLGSCDAGIESVGAAQFALRTLDAFDKEFAGVRDSTLAELLKLGAELVSEKYERSAEVQERDSGVSTAFEQMGALSAEKRPILDDHLAREIFKEALRIKAVAHDDRYNKLAAWCAEKEEYLNVREEINSIAEADENIGLLGIFDEDFKAMEPSSVAPLKALGQEILTAEYKTQYSQYVYHLPDEITGHEADIDAKWAQLSELAAEKHKYLDESLAREKRKEELRLEFASTAGDFSRWSKDVAENFAMALFGFTLEEVEAYATELAQSEAATAEARAAKKGAYEAVWGEMQAMNFSDNVYTTLTVEALAECDAALQTAIDTRHAKYDEELARQRANDALCKEFAEVADPFAKWIVDTKDAITQAKEKLRDQLANVQEKRASADAEAAPKLESIHGLQEKMDAEGITNNRHTLLTAKDVDVLWEQYKSFLEKKEEMLNVEIEAEELRGLTPEQMKEIEDNFAQFDKDKSGSIDPKELKACLYSLGEEVSQARVAEIIKEYGDGKIISYEGFKKFMIHIFGDTDSKEDVLAGWNLIAKGEAVVKDEAMDVILGAEDIAYIKETAPQKDGGYDYTAWTEDVFSR